MVRSVLTYTMKAMYRYWTFVLAGLCAVAITAASARLVNAQPQTDIEIPSSASAAVATPLPSSPPPPTHAVNLTVSPISLLLEADPGTQVSSTIRILNNATETEYLTLELATFAAAPGGTQPVIRPFTDTEPQKDWLTFSEKNITALPGEWKTVGVTFAPPRESSLSYYYAIIVKRQSDVVAAEGESVVTGAPAILVLSTVHSPNARQELRLGSFSTKQRVYEFLPSEFEVTVENTGNVHLAPFGNVFIDSGTTKDLAVLSVNAGNGMVLPGSSRVFATSWAEGFPVYKPVLEDNKPVFNKDGSPKQKLSWDFSQMNKLRFGKYTAQLLMVYDNGERDVPVESTLTFWVVPWRFLAAAVTVVLFVVLGITASVAFVLRTLRSRHVRQPRH